MCACVAWAAYMRWSFVTGLKTSAGSVVSRLLLSASHKRFGMPSKARRSISRRLLDSKNSFSKRSRPANVPAVKCSSKLPPTCSSCSWPKLHQRSGVFLNVASHLLWRTTVFILGEETGRETDKRVARQHELWQIAKILKDFRRQVSDGIILHLEDFERIQTVKQFLRKSFDMIIVHLDGFQLIQSWEAKRHFQAQSIVKKKKKRIPTVPVNRCAGSSVRSLRDKSKSSSCVISLNKLSSSSSSLLLDKWSTVIRLRARKKLGGIAVSSLFDKSLHLLMSIFNLSTLIRSVQTCSVSKLMLIMSIFSSSCFSLFLWIFLLINKKYLSAPAIVYHFICLQINQVLQRVKQGTRQILDLVIKQIPIKSKTESLFQMIRSLNWRHQHTIQWEGSCLWTCLY